jgi:hypothetical protein
VKLPAYKTRRGIKKLTFQPVYPLFSKGGFGKVAIIKSPLISFFQRGKYEMRTFHPRLKNGVFKFIFHKKCQAGDKDPVGVIFLLPGRTPVSSSISVQKKSFTTCYKTDS